MRQYVPFCCPRGLAELLRFLRKWDVFVRISRAGSIKKPPDAAGGVDPWQNRTVDNLLRRQVLYPAELKGRARTIVHLGRLGKGTETCATNAELIV